jgi:ABC-type uncharacterized transport system ATPase subunit
MMVGREVLLQVHKPEQELGEMILKVENLSAKNNRHLPVLKDVSFEVRAGEILGIAGVEGNGQTELIEVLTGLRQAVSGHIYLQNKDITKFNPKEVREVGVSHIPQDRHKFGLLLNFSIAENLILGRHYKKPYANRFFLKQDIIYREANRLIEEYDVRTTDIELPAKSMSGGNQQKAIIAREFDSDPILLVAAQPTRGVDVGAIEFIHKRIVDQRNKGKGVLLVSLELDEVMSLSDRIAVMYEGQIMAILDQKDATEQKLGMLMAGAKLEERSEA